MGLKNWKVILKRSAICYGSAFVVAETEDEARKAALEQSEAEQGEVIWDIEEWPDDDAEIFAVEMTYDPAVEREKAK